MLNWQIITAALLAFGMSGCSMANEEADAPEFVAEVIVRFSSDGQIGLAIAESLGKGGEPNADVERFAARLSKETGVPFEAVRLTSGRELILELRTEGLLAELERHVSKAPDVAACRRTTDKRSSPYRRDEVLVSFAEDSRSYAELSRIEPSTGRPDPALAELTASLVAGFDYPVTPRRLPSGEFMLSIDVNALTNALVSTLSERDDVDYAQPNFIMRPY